MTRYNVVQLNSATSIQQESEVEIGASLLDLRHHYQLSLLKAIYHDNDLV